jgi:hypothetical protein
MNNNALISKKEYEETLELLDDLTDRMATPNDARYIGFLDCFLNALWLGKLCMKHLTSLTHQDTLR